MPVSSQCECFQCGPSDPSSRPDASSDEGIKVITAWLMDIINIEAWLMLLTVVKTS